MDLDAAEAAAAGFLRALGIGLDPAHMRAKPRRMARAWAERLTARPFAMTTFPNEGGSAVLGDPRSDPRSGQEFLSLAGAAP